MSHLGLADPWGKNSAKVDALFKGGQRDLGGNFVVVRIFENSPILNTVIDVIARGECGTTKTAPDPLLDWVYHG